ncbi:MAG: hypothetical protein Q4C61_11510 [Lachnospiraceae bacterium]|nr:hypothetical protein [Lachnospiraceae bacterium]
MMHRYLVRYMILILILILCAGAALYFTETSVDSHEDAVLAQLANPVMQADAEESFWCRTAVDAGFLRGADAEERVLRGQGEGEEAAVL